MANEYLNRIATTGSPAEIIRLEHAIKRLRNRSSVTIEAAGVPPQRRHCICDVHHGAPVRDPCLTRAYWFYTRSRPATAAVRRFVRSPGSAYVDLSYYEPLWLVAGRRIYSGGELVARAGASDNTRAMLAIVAPQMADYLAPADERIGRFEEASDSEGPT